MKDHISFYAPQKTYSSASISWPIDDEELELSYVGDGNIGFITDMGTRSHVNVVNPYFYVCRNKGIVRVNRMTCIEVSIPDDFIARVRNLSSIEFTLTYDNNPMETHRATVEHLLRFPDFLIHEKPPRKGPDIDLDELERPLGKDDDEACCPPRLKNAFSIRDEDLRPAPPPLDDKEEEPCWPGIPPRILFSLWINSHDGEILYESNNGIVLAHDRHNLMLVSFFDKRGPDWLADEEEFNGGKPLWFSESSHVVSPLYDLAHVAEHINKLTYGHVLPLVIIGDHITILNSEDMAETWDKMGVRVCYCFREEDGLEPFFNFLENAAENSTECHVPGEEEMKALKNELMKYDKENA